MRSIWIWLRGLNVSHFLRQVAVVVFSVGMTLLGGRLYEQNKRETGVKESLGLVRDELAFNLQEVEASYELLRLNQYYFAQMHRYRDSIERVPADTLKFWLTKTMSSVSHATSTYALDALKDLSSFSELKNSLLIYLCRVYGLGESYVKQCDHYFAETGVVFAQFNELVHQRKPKSVYQAYAEFLNLQKFRLRVERTEIMAHHVERGRQAVLGLRRSIVILDSLMVGNGYKEIEFDPEVDYFSPLEHSEF